MALLIEMETDSGIIVAYHKIESTNINWHIQEVTFTVASYRDEEARLNGKSAVERVDISLLKEDFTIIDNSNILQTLYTWFKKNAVGFENAVDV